MFRFCLIITLITNTCLPSLAQTDNSPLRDGGAYELSHINADIISGRIELAREGLDKLLKQENLKPLIRHTADLLNSHINGHYKKRMQFWLNREVVDTVVLVPDEYSALKVMEQWTVDRFWPVLIEDGWFTPMFIDAFKPDKVVRIKFTPPAQQPQDQSEPDNKEKPDKNSNEKEPSEDPDTKPLTQSPADRLTQQLLVNNNRYLASQIKEQTPPGFVLIDPDSNQRLAGVALALGRGQPASMLNYKQKTQPYASPEEIRQISNAALNIMNRWKLISKTEWSAITLTGDYPWRYRAAKDWKPNFPRGIPYKWAPLATTDLIGRDPADIRLAVSGQLHGDTVQSLYQAMCSLFIQPRRVLFFDDYSNRGQTFAPYGLADADILFRDRYATSLYVKKSISPAMFRKITRPTNPYDLMFINSSGGTASWQIQGTATHEDIMIGRPVAVHMIHSFSAGDLDSTDSLAGRALAGGAFWFYGSVFEPYLVAFTHPTGIAHKAYAGTPLAFAARHIPGHPMYVPWRVALIGDPLYTLRETPAKRLDLDLYKDQPKLVELLKFEIAKENKDWPAILRLSIIVHTAQPNSSIGDDSRGMTIAAINALKERDKLHPSDLGQIALRLKIADNIKPLADISPELAIKHPIAKSAYRIQLYDQYKEILKQKHFAKAEKMLDDIFTLRDSSHTMREQAKAYLDAMAGAGKQKQGIAFIKQYAEDEDTPRKIKYPMQRVLKEWKP